MVKVVFKNLEASEFVRNVAAEKVEKTINKFSELAQLATSSIVVTSNMTAQMTS